MINMIYLQYMKKDLFKDGEKDATKPLTITLRGSLIDKVKADSKRTGLNVSKIIDTILDDYYNSK